MAELVCCLWLWVADLHRVSCVWLPGNAPTYAATLALVLASIAAAAAIAHYAGLISIWPARGRGALSDDASFGSGSQALGSAGSLSLSGGGCSLAAS